MTNSMISNMIQNVVRKFIRTTFHKQVSITEHEVETLGPMYVSIALKRIFHFIQNHVSEHDKKDLEFASYNWAALPYELNGKFFFMDGNVIRFSRNQLNSGYTILYIDIYGLDAPEISKILGKIIYSVAPPLIVADSLESQTVTISRICGKGEPDVSSFRDKHEMPRLKDVVGKSAKKVLSIIQRFINSKELYHRYRIPYNIKILLYGERGTGKTSLALAVAARYVSNVVMITSESDINQLTNVPSGLKIKSGLTFQRSAELTLYVFEEFDLILEKYKNDNRGIDLLLQILSGVSELPGAIIIMTTNYIDKIDPRVLRARRVDYIIEMTNLSYDEILPMASRFHISIDEMNKCLSDCHVDKDQRYNPAEVEAAILEYCKEYKIKGIVNEHIQ